MSLKSKTISLTKNEIIKAINTEPLGARDEFTTTAPAKKACKVCAVGAVIRFAGGNRATLKNLLKQTKADFVDNCDNNTVWSNYSYNKHVIINDAAVLALQNNSSPLSALSSYYEALKRARKTLPKIRATLTNYVRNNFPARTEITVNL